MKRLLSFLGNGDDKDEKQVLLSNHPSTLDVLNALLKLLVELLFK